MLDLTHDRLKNERYLTEVVYEGRGKSETVTYTFLAAPEPEVRVVASIARKPPLRNRLPT
jgi:hypothetical protein